MSDIKEKKSKNSKMPILLILCASVVLVFFSFKKYHDSENAILEKKEFEKKKQDEQAKGDTQKVRVYQVNKKDFIHTMDTLGTIIAKNKVAIKPEVPGKIYSINIEEGDEITEGEVLFELEHNDAELKLDFRSSKLKEANYDRNNWEAKLSTSKGLLEAGAISKSNYDETESNYYRAVQAVKSAQIELQSAQAELDKTFIKSPIDGVVGKIEVPQGEYVSPQNKVMTVLEVDEIHVEFSVLEKDITDVSEGQKIDMLNDTYPDKTFKGEIVSLGVSVDTTEGRVRKVKAVVDNKDHKLLPGMFAHIKVILYSKKDVIAIPDTAFLDVAQDATKVWVIKDKNKVETREVNVEHLNLEEALIKEGLSVGDLVVIDVATLQLKPDQEVEVVEVTGNENKKA